MVKLRTLFEVISTAKSEAEAQTLFDEANKEEDYSLDLLDKILLKD